VSQPRGRHAEPEDRYVLVAHAQVRKPKEFVKLVSEAQVLMGASAERR
jgi:hypothetical protein